MELPTDLNEDLSRIEEILGTGAVPGSTLGFTSGFLTQSSSTATDYEKREAGVKSLLDRVFNLTDKGTGSLDSGELFALRQTRRELGHVAGEVSMNPD